WLVRVAACATMAGGPLIARGGEMSPEVEQALSESAALLVSLQEKSPGAAEEALPREWPYEGVYRAHGEIPIGYRIGGTAICASALVRAPGYGSDATRREVVERATRFILDG